MDSPEKHPLSDMPKVDTSELSIEERITRLEQIVHALAEHQTTLGGSLITCHGKLLDHAKILHLSGAEEAAAAIDPEHSKQLIVNNRPAPLVHPGGHPLKKG